MKEQAKLKSILNEWKSLSSEVEEAEILSELSYEENDEKTGSEVQVKISALYKQVERLEFKRMLGEPEDPNNAIISINSGAGGTEAQDWTEMLLRMYLRYCEIN